MSNSNTLNNDIVSLMKENLEIILQQNDIDELFLNLDNIFEYTLREYSINKPFNISHISTKIELIGGKELSKVLDICLNMFCIDNFGYVRCIEFLKELKIDQHLFKKLKLFLVKYGSRYAEITDIDFNELGWKRIRKNIVQVAKELYMLELKVDLNNNSTLTFRDTPDSMLSFACTILEALIDMKDTAEYDDELLEELKNKVALLTKNR